MGFSERVTERRRLPFSLLHTLRFALLPAVTIVPLDPIPKLATPESVLILVNGASGPCDVAPLTLT